MIFLILCGILACAGLAAFASIGTLIRVGWVVAQIDDLNAGVAALGQDVAALQAEVAAVVPAAPVDLSGAIAGVASADAAVKQATSDLRAKFPPAQ